MAIGCVIPVGAYASWFHSRTGHYGVSESAGFYLWGRVSSFADCAVIKPTGGAGARLPDRAADQADPAGQLHLARAPRCTRPHSTGGPVTPANNKLLTDFAIHAIEAQPLGYAKTVVKDMMLSFGFPRIAYPGAGTVYYYSFHLTTSPLSRACSRPTTTSWIKGGTAYQDWAELRPPGAGPGDQGRSPHRSRCTSGWCSPTGRCSR